MASPAAVALSSLACVVGDAGLELADHVVGAGRLLRVAAAPLLVLDRADGLLDLAHPALEVLHPVARHLAGGVPAVGEVAEGLLGGLEVGDRDQRLGLDEDLPP